MSPPIWTELEQASFYKNVNKLNMTAGGRDLSQIIPNSSSCTTHEDDGRSAPSIEHERQLAEDFAFIAAWEKSHKCITAACLSYTTDWATMHVTMAGNHGIKPEVKGAMSEILNLLQQCALLRK